MLKGMNDDDSNSYPAREIYDVGNSSLPIEKCLFVQNLNDDVEEEDVSAVHLIHGIASDALLHSISGTDNQSSDLIPGKYGGGLKIWECTYDLIGYLLSIQSSLRNRTFLDLGCGHGLAGIFAMICGASDVIFQDLNAQVLSTVTSFNVAENVKEFGVHRESCRIRYIAGHWGDKVMCKIFGARVPDGFDYIVTSETIYSKDSHDLLLDVIVSVLKKPGGIALVAAKSFYFGVGGGTISFYEHVTTSNILSCKRILKELDMQGSLVRELLMLSWNI